MLMATQEKQKSIITLRRGGQPVSCDKSKLFIDVWGWYLNHLASTII